MNRRSKREEDESKTDSHERIGELRRQQAPYWSTRCLSGLARSPQNGRVLVVRHTPENTADENLWLLDLPGGSYHRATSTPGRSLPHVMCFPTSIEELAPSRRCVLAATPIR
jgi:hypothetical protein